MKHKIWTSAFGLVFCVLLSDHLLKKCNYGVTDRSTDLSTFMWQPSCWAVTSTSFFLAQQQLNLPAASTLCIQPGGCACFSASNHSLELFNLCSYIWKGHWAEFQKVHSIVRIGDPEMKLWQQRITLQWSVFGCLRLEWRVDITEVMWSFYPPCFYKWTCVSQESRYQV